LGRADACRSETAPQTGLLTNLLFLCSRNRLRSPTAEQVFASRPGVETASAGLAPDAEEQVTPDHLDWADLIFVMERAHRAKLQRRFGQHLKGKRVVCLDVPDVPDSAFGASGMTRHRAPIVIPAGPRRKPGGEPGR
jgi:predicted protein tyrosine phosphatase